LGNVTWLYIIARSRVARALAALGAFLVWLGLTKRKARQEGAEQQRAKDAAEANKRVDAGRKAVADGRGAGTPDERLRRNDGRWD